MKVESPIVIFAYSFPHKKSFDFISIMASKGFFNLLVIGAPKVELKNNGAKNSSNISLTETCDVQVLCSLLNIRFLECPHDDLEGISKAKASIGAEIAIISGARILGAEIIKLFPMGVVNFHPGKIPETSGLDSYFYTIKTGSPMGITVHLIDKRVDAGKLIFFEKLPVGHGDTFDSLLNALYLTQLRALGRYIDLFFGSDQEYMDIDRPKKNHPLENSEKGVVREGFDSWRMQQIGVQKDIENKFFDMCEQGSVSKVKKLVSDNMYLLCLKNCKGWSGIIIAAFWQNEELVRYLLEMGADPNDCGNNGTSVLMYSKTKLIENKSANLIILSLLISRGADIDAKDNYGKTIFHYLDQNSQIGELITSYLNASRAQN